jgi:hypothetical protein
MTTTRPLVAPLGTGTTILVSDQDVGVPTDPLNVTLLGPWLAPKPAPIIVTSVPTVPFSRAKLTICGASAAVTARGTIKQSNNAADKKKRSRPIYFITPPTRPIIEGISPPGNLWGNGTPQIGVPAPVYSVTELVSACFHRISRETTRFAGESPL